MDRKLECVICLPLAALALPVCLLLYMAVGLALGRPVMFRQTRAGQAGKTFELIKFRSLTEARDGAGELLPDVARMTRFGALLRRSRLDELPQLYSILAGHMALVGPRPLLPLTITSFGRAGQMRSAVRPGLTGWSQVSGNTHLSDPEKLSLDLWYVAHRGTALDLRILCETFGVALWGERRREDRLMAAHHWLRSQSELRDLSGDIAPDQQKGVV